MTEIQIKKPDLDCLLISLGKVKKILSTERKGNPKVKTVQNQSKQRFMSLIDEVDLKILEKLTNPNQGFAELHLHLGQFLTPEIYQKTDFYKTYGNINFLTSMNHYEACLNSLKVLFAENQDLFSGLGRDNKAFISNIGKILSVNLNKSPDKVTMQDILRFLDSN